MAADQFLVQLGQKAFILSLLMKHDKLLTGLRDLDLFTGGFQPGELIVLAGQSASGKTALALTLAQKLSLQADATVAYYCLEMTQKQLLARLLASLAPVDLWRIRAQCLTEQELSRLGQALARLEQARCHLFCGTYSLSKICETAAHLQAASALDILIIDFVQLLQTADQNWSYKQRENFIARELKRLALELDIPVLAISQLANARRAGPPALEDFKEWEALQQYSDLTLLLDSTQSSADQNGLSQLLIAKQRNGPTGTIYLVWLAQISRFENLYDEFRPDQSQIPEQQDGWVQVLEKAAAWVNHSHQSVANPLHDNSLNSSSIFSSAPQTSLNQHPPAENQTRTAQSAVKRTSIKETLKNSKKRSA